MNRDFWIGKKVFLTGHTGFKGSWMALWLNQLGADVTGFSLPTPTNPSLFDLANVKEHVTNIIGDIRDESTLATALHKAEPEIVIHMAAQSLVRHSYTHPVETYSTNVMGTVNLLEAVKATPSVKATLIVTSDKCYENTNQTKGYCEDDPMGGFDPYSSSKGCAELITSTYQRSYELSVASVRAGNVIGGGDWAEDRLIPDLLRSIENGQKAILRNPIHIRPWQHVLEPLFGYLLLCEALYNNGFQYSGGWNFGPEESDFKTVEWIAQYLTQKWGNGANYEIQQSDEALHEACILSLDCTKAQSLLGWKPLWDLEIALDKIIDWQKAYVSQKNMYEVTLGQISTYMECS